MIAERENVENVVDMCNQIMVSGGQIKKLFGSCRPSVKTEFYAAKAESSRIDVGQVKYLAT